MTNQTGTEKEDTGVDSGEGLELDGGKAVVVPWVCVGGGGAM